MDAELASFQKKKRKKHIGAEGEKGHRRLDRPGRARGGGAKWIHGAIKHPGALHRSLGVPEGEKIPASKIEKAAHSDNPTLARRARFAQTLKGLGHKKD